MTGVTGRRRRWREGGSSDEKLTRRWRAIVDDGRVAWVIDWVTGGWQGDGRVTGWREGDGGTWRRRRTLINEPSTRPRSWMTGEWREWSTGWREGDRVTGGWQGDGRATATDTDQRAVRAAACSPAAWCGSWRAARSWCPSGSGRSPAACCSGSPWRPAGAASSALKRKPGQQCRQLGQRYQNRVTTAGNSVSGLTPPETRSTTIATGLSTPTEIGSTVSISGSTWSITGSTPAPPRLTLPVQFI